MSDQIAVVFDASALTAYLEGNVSVGELMLEVADEGRQVAIPAACLAVAFASVADEIDAALLALMMTAPMIRLLPLAAGDVRDTGKLARAVDGDISFGHAASAALTHEAHYATVQPKEAAKVLPARWSILDLA
ncbi:hypothetical protein [Micromonospora ureilytica]|uniref:PIN domain-containing protein n=1 Tax=Micromonospora ureilytica TaxID=709868 RepID=A0ABS0JP56_9ACTN|nr:hypothetical protein [Micromonospora ureilytica]MBG6068834.1 hypothetical protein [Micromonospora ureilytica]WSR57801.1 hypothetical protein OG400_06270 [Micromonospora ureilytica]